MNLYHLRYFVTLAHLEHYTKAADVLAITQPSLSHAISSLEEELGVKLFRKKRTECFSHQIWQVFSGGCGTNPEPAGFLRKRSPACRKGRRTDRCGFSQNSGC